MSLFTIHPAKKDVVPIIISVPHAGTKFPLDTKLLYKKRMRKRLDDTDWYVDQLYKFAPKWGITVVKANYSRWLIDLNRDPESTPLYSDKRLITSITPTTDFYGNAIYKSGKEPNKNEVERRLQQYYWPYYRQVEKLLDDRKQKFGKVLLWDAHSIRHRVSTISPDPFPDMILGNNEGKTAHPKLIEAALSGLKSGSFEVSHNSPFKGGHITRFFGKPDTGLHALQLEMNKILYMDDNELTYNKQRAQEVKKVLKTTLGTLIDTIKTL